MKFDRDAADFAVKVILTVFGFIAFIIFSIILCARFPWVGIPFLLLGLGFFGTLVIYNTVRDK